MALSLKSLCCARRMHPQGEGGVGGNNQAEPFRLLAGPPRNKGRVGLIQHLGFTDEVELEEAANI